MTRKQLNAEWARLIAQIYALNAVDRTFTERLKGYIDAIDPNVRARILK